MQVAATHADHRRFSPMTHGIKQALAIGAVFLAPVAAFAEDFSSDTTYSHPYGMVAGQENQPVNASLRDANGNLTIVNGQFTSSSMSQQSGLSTMSSGVGVGGSQATAVGNSLNVVTVGSGNTVIVNAHQENNGNQTATVSTNGQ
jgi:holdfast attachment protein HfaA